MDTITVRQSDKLYVHWPEGGGFQQIEILINSVPLIELVRTVELPYAEEEFDQRTADGESIDDLGPRGVLAGDYHYLPPSIALPPSQNYFGERLCCMNRVKVTRIPLLVILKHQPKQYQVWRSESFD